MKSKPKENTKLMFPPSLIIYLEESGFVPYNDTKMFKRLACRDNFSFDMYVFCEQTEEKDIIPSFGIELFIYNINEQYNLIELFPDQNCKKNYLFNLTRKVEESCNLFTMVNFFRPETNNI